MLILSIDGGGVRGVLAAKLLQRLEAAYPGLLSKVDLFAGASTGAIIAMGLAYGLSPDDVVRFYTEGLPRVFRQSWWRKFTTMWYAKYDNSVLIEELESVFGDTTVDQLEKDIFVATYYLGTKEPVLRRARARFYDASDTRLRVADLALWSASAPTYFPSADRHVDGGLSANNCAVCAMAYQERRGTPFSEMKVLSVGTGQYPVVLDGGDKGLSYWGQNLLIPFVDGSVDVADFQARQFLADEGTYHRLQPILPAEIEIDKVAEMSGLIEIAETFNIQPTVNWLIDQFGAST